MVVLIAMLTGISDIAALIALFGVNACMILFGILMEARPAEPGVGWAPFWFGCVAGAVPWIAIGAYLSAVTARRGSSSGSSCRSSSSSAASP